MEQDVEVARRFIQKLNTMVDQLEKDKRLVVHSRINQFQYMTSKEELTILLNRYDDTKAILENTSLLIRERYREIQHRYEMDAELIRNL